MRFIASTFMAGLILLSPAGQAYADPPHGRYERGRDHDRSWSGREDRGGYRDDRRYDRRRERWDDRRDHDWDDRWDDRWDNRWDNRWSDPWGGRGWYDARGFHHDWRPGDYFRYRPGSSAYVVITDYHRYRLPPPRYGEHYYRDAATGEILLIAAATGLILWALTN